MSSKFSGPYRVVEILGKGKVKIKDLASFVERVVHLDLVKIIPEDIDPLYELEKEPSNPSTVSPQMSDDGKSDSIATRTRARRTIF